MANVKTEFNPANFVEYPQEDWPFIMEPTPTKHNLALRKGNFENLAEALDYAAGGQTGYNFYDGT